MNRKLISSNREKQNIYFHVKSVDEENYIVEGVFSTQVEDRHNEVVVQGGWKLDNYMKNPVVLWAHEHDSFPIAKMLEIGVNTTNELAGKMQFAVKEYDKAATAFNLIKGKYLNAFSAGFINNKYEIDQENNIVILTENELLEVSVVPVPANQLALAKKKGIDVGAFEQDEQKSTEVSTDEAVEALTKSNIETIRKAIETLTEVSKTLAKTDSKVGSKVEHASSKEVGQKKVSVKLMNNAIRALLGVKKNITS